MCVLGWWSNNDEKSGGTSLKALRQHSEQWVAIKGSVLLGIYLIIPLCFFVVAVDYLYFGWQLRDSVFPKNPEDLLIWHIFFVFPHIFSSLITLADKEYIAFYGRRFGYALLAIGIVVLLFNVAVPLVFTGETEVTLSLLFFVILAFATMYHVLSQQLGVSMTLMKLKTAARSYELWRWLNALAGTFLYFMAFAGMLLKDSWLFGSNMYDVCRDAALLLMIFANAQGIFLALKARTRVGLLYAFANIIMLTAIYVMIALGYSFFAIVIPRVIHDVTAFSIYSVHDRNRNVMAARNYFYRFLAFLKLSPLILCVVMAVVIAQLLQCGSFYLDAWLGFQPVSVCLGSAIYTPEIKNTINNQSMQVWLQLSLIAALFHYYVESVIWKKDSLHRHYVNFK